MNINKYIEQAYQFFTALAKELVKELKPDHKMMAKHSEDVSMAIVEANKAIIEAIQEGTHKVVTSVNDKEVVESVNINNLDELTQGIEGIISTLKTELGKIDKEIVVKNDLSQLTALFKSGEDKKDLVKALKRIEDGVKTEQPDYTIILDELVALTERIAAKESKDVDLSGVQDMLAQISVGVNDKFDFARYTNKDRFKVELSDEQLEKMGGAVTVASGGGNTETIVASVNAQTTTSSEEAILLRRMVKIMESLAVTDVAKRQKVAIEYIAGTTLGHAVTGLSSGAGIASTNAPFAGAPLTSAGTIYMQPVWVGPVDQRYQIKDQARAAYANSIRANLSFT